MPSLAHVSLLSTTYVASGRSNKIRHMSSIFVPQCTVHNNKVTTLRVTQELLNFKSSKR